MLEFNATSFDRAGGPSRDALCSRLAAEIAERLASASTFQETVRSLVSELRILGHDLWSWDEDGETFEIWGPDYMTAGSRGILVTFRSDAPSEVVWWPAPGHKTERA